METGKFIMSGQDKKLLSGIKNTLVASGFVFIGYSREQDNILRQIRAYAPDIVIVEVCNNFRLLKEILKVVDEDLLAACILILDSRSDEVMDFLRNSRVVTYLSKPAFPESLLQITDISLMSFKRILQYESKVKKLNDILEGRRVMEKAKWLLVEQEGMTESEAYEAIKKKSRDNRLPMRDIADAIILTRGAED